MHKVNNKFILILFILAGSAVLAGGLLLAVNNIFHPFEWTKPLVQEAVDPETQLDEEVLAASSNVADIRHDEENQTTTVTYTSLPIEYQVDNTGEYAPIDTTIVESDSDYYAYENNTNVFKTYFEKAPSDYGFVTYQAPNGRGVEFTFANALTSDDGWEVQDNQATYKGLYKGMDVRYTVDNSSLLEEIIVNNKKRAQALDTVSQSVHLDNVYYKLQEGDVITFHNEDTKKISFISPPPVMYELNNPDNFNHDIHYSITEMGEGSVQIDKVIEPAGKEWLENATYPIVIDGSYYGSNYYNGMGEIQWSRKIPSWWSNYTISNGDSPYRTALMTGRWTDGDICVLGPCPHYKDWRHYFSFRSGISSSLGIEYADIVGAKLTLYMYRGYAFSGVGEPIRVYSGLDEWGDLYSGGEQTLIDAWDAMDTMTLEETLDVTGLPDASTQDCRYGDSEPCKVEIDIDKSSVGNAFSERTSIVLDPSLISFNKNVDKVVYTYKQIGGTDSPWPTLEVIYFDSSPPTGTFLEVDPKGGQASSTGRTTMEIKVYDHYVNETNFALQRSFTNPYSWEDVCPNMISGEMSRCYGGTNKVCDGGFNDGGICYYQADCEDGVNDGVCVGGYCTSNADCPGSPPGTCNHRCVGGDNDGDVCRFDSNCTGGTCEYVDCIEGAGYDCTATSTETAGVCNGGFNDGGTCELQQDCENGVNDGTCEYNNYCVVEEEFDATYAPNINYSDKQAWYRARVEQDDFASNWSSVKNDYTYANAQPDQPAIARSDRWDEVYMQLNLGGGIPGYYNNQTTTKYCVGFWPQDEDLGWYVGSSTGAAGLRFTDDPAATYPVLPDVYVVHADGLNPAGYPVVNNLEDTIPPITPKPKCLDLNDWIYNSKIYFNTVGEYFFSPMKFRPNDKYWVMTLSQNTRDKSLNYPSFASWEEVTTRARNPGAPTWDDSDVQASSLNLAMNTTPASDPSYTNPSDTQYAMYVEELNAYLNPADLDATSVSPIWRTAAQWGSGKEYDVFLPHTCYNIKAKSKNRAGVEGEDKDASIWSATTVACTELAVPEVTDVSCDYNETDGYYCDVSVDTKDNPAGTEYYIEQGRWRIGFPSNTVTYSTAMNWSVRNDDFVFRASGLTCGMMFFKYDYKVRARLGADITSYSAVVNDSNHLPPCAPTNVSGSPAYNGDQTIMNWGWNPSSGGSTCVNYNVYNYDGASDTYIDQTDAIFPHVYQQTVTPNTAYRAKVAGVDTYGREGQRSNPSSEVWSYPRKPGLDGVSCEYSEVSGLYTCEVTVDTNGNPVGAPANVQYQIARSACGLDSSGNEVNCGSYAYPFGGSSAWYSYNPGQKLTDNESGSGLDCSADNKKYRYYIRAKNTGNIPTPYLPVPPVADVLPPCPAESMIHNSNYYDAANLPIEWGWNPPGSYDAQGFEIDYYNLYDDTDQCIAGDGTDGYCSSPLFPEVDHTSGAQHTFTQTFGTDYNIEKFAYVRAVDVNGKAGAPSSTASAYTAIQEVQGFEIISADITQKAIPLHVSGDFANFSTPYAGLQLLETTGHSGGGALSGEDKGFESGVEDWLPEGERETTDTELEANTEYCYQARSRNSDGNKDQPGDVNDPKPDTAVCRYTKANTPTLPILRRGSGGTEVSLTLRSNDENPLHDGHASGGETQYAICVSKYDDNDQLVSEKYVQLDGTVDEAGLDCNENEGFNLVGHWGSRNEWGGDTGVDIIGLDPSYTYDFKAKARNGNDGDIDTNGCTPDYDCWETHFGREATLFLVKNNVVGWGWSSNTGWISLNCLNMFNATGDYSCHSADDWGLNTQFEESREINPLEGYGWSSSGQARLEYWDPSFGPEPDTGQTGAWGIAYDAVTDGATQAWVTTAAPSNKLIRVKASDLSYTAYDLGNDLRSVAFDGEFIWVVSQGDDVIYKFDPSTGSALPIGSGSVQLPGAADPYDVVIENGYVWVSNEGNDTVTKINAADSSIIDTYSLPAEADPHGLYYDGRYIWSANNSDVSISKIDPLLGSAEAGSVTTYNLSAAPEAVTGDGKYLWIARQGGVTVLDIEGNVVDTIDINANPMADITLYGGFAWLSDTNANQVYRINKVDYTIVAIYTDVAAPRQIADDPNNEQLFIVNNSGTINVSTIARKQQTTKTGLGWVSLHKKVCDNNAQAGCYDDTQCGTGLCTEESAGLPPDGKTYGYCYNDPGNERYGDCAIGGNACTEGNESANCTGGDGDYCIFTTCSRLESGPAQGTCLVNETCKSYATASLNGVTREVDGWARILTLKQRGEDQGQTDWGWIKLNGEYTAQDGTAGNYGLTGTEVDSQVFLGAPDVNPTNVELYSLFGWGQTAERSDFNSESSWLHWDNISKTNQVNTYSSSSIAVDSVGNPHIAWAEQVEGSGWTNVYYVQRTGNQWYSVTGEAYVPGSTPSANISQADNSFSNYPVVKLDANDNPHVAWQEGSNIFYLRWNPDDNQWQTASGVSYASALADPAANKLQVNTSAAGGVAMQLDRNGYPHFTYSSDNEIYYRYWDGSDWATTAGGGNVSQSGSTSVNCSHAPQLVLGNETVQRPHIVWLENNSTMGSCQEWGAVYYRYWNGSSWSTAGSWPGSIHVNDDVADYFEPGDPADNYHGDMPSLALDSNNLPGVVWRDPHAVFYKKWDPSADSGNGDWIPDSSYTAPTIPDFDDLWVDRSVEPTSSLQSGSLAIAMKNDQPHIVWAEQSSQPDEVVYRYWDPTDGAWKTISRDYSTPSGSTSDDNYFVSQTPSDGGYSPTFTFDRWGNPHVIWTEFTYNGDYCGEFSTVDTPAGSARDIKIDQENEYLYIAGDNRIEKRTTDSGDLVTDFGANGVVTPADNIDIWSMDIDIANGYMYVAGNGGGFDWQIEKRLLSTGALVADFGTNGIVNVADGRAEYGVSLDYDDGYVYVGGYNDATNWRIEKRYADSGDLVGSFGGSIATPLNPNGDPAGVITATDGQEARKVLVDGSYLYIGGYGADDNWRIEKRLLSTGALVTDFGANGVVIGPEASHSVYDMALDGTYLYAVGRSDAYTEVVGKYNKATGSLDTAFDGDGLVEVGGWENVYPYAMALDEENMYLYGTVVNSPGDPFEFRYEKRLLTDGSLVNAFGSNGVVYDSIDGFGYEMVLDDQYLYAIGKSGDVSGGNTNWHIVKRWLHSGGEDGTGSNRDCTDSDYPLCIYDYPRVQCAASNIAYSRWFPGVLRSGVGWIEFLPVGALLGIPWLETQYSDIYAGLDIQLAPPPRGSDRYTSTFLILANGDIQGISGYYNETQTGLPTSRYYTSGLDSLITGAGYPVGENALSQINISALTTTVDGTRNRYGHEVVTYSGGDLSDAGRLGQQPILDSKVYYINGNATLENDMTFMHGDSGAAGNGLIIVDGDLEINANIYYEKGCDGAATSPCQTSQECGSGETCQSVFLDDVSEMPSAAFIVEGNVYMNSLVHEVSGVVVAKGDEGVISTSRRQPVSQTIQAANDDTYVTFDGDYTNFNTSGSLRFGQEDGSSGYLLPQEPKRTQLAAQASVPTVLGTETSVVPENQGRESKPAAIGQPALSPSKSLTSNSFVRSFSISASDYSIANIGDPCVVSPRTCEASEACCDRGRCTERWEGIGAWACADCDSYQDACAICCDRFGPNTAQICEFGRYSTYQWTGNGGSLNCCGDDANEANPYEATETSCSDGNDNDCDGDIDGADADCGGGGGDIGDACTVNGDCNNNQCVDGYCCDSPCSGNCDFCNLSKPGFCTSDDAACAGDCDSCVSGNCSADQDLCVACEDCQGSGTAYNCTVLADGSQDTTGINLCNGVNDYCCGGTCATGGGSYGSGCGSGVCAGTWACDATVAECSTEGNPCDTCTGDTANDASCNTSGTCTITGTTDCSACTQCVEAGNVASCSGYYASGSEDTVAPGTCVTPNSCNGSGVCLTSEITVDLTASSSLMLIPFNEQYIGEALTLTSVRDGATIDGITLTESGTANGAVDITNVKLFYEVVAIMGSCSYEGTENQYGSTTNFSSDDGTASFNGSVAVNNGQMMCVYVVADVLNSASPGDTLGIGIDDPPNDITVSGATNVGPSNSVVITADLNYVTHRALLRWPFGQDVGEFNVPPGSEIRHANIKLYGDGKSVGNDFEGRIYLIDYADTYPFDESTPPLDSPEAIFTIATSNSVSYDTTGWDDTDNAENTTPEIKSLIQKYINSDEYEQRYYDGDDLYLGLIFKENSATPEGFKSFHSMDSGNPPELIIEYSPHQSLYTISDQADDVVAWGTDPGDCEFTGDCDFDPPCMSFGAYSINPNRIFFRFTPVGDDANNRVLPQNAQIEGAAINLIGDSCCNVCNQDFQARIGLLNEANMPVISANPYDYSLSQDVSEVARDLPATAWDDTTRYLFTGLEPLLEAWIDTDNYDYVEGNVSGFRLRRGLNETSVDAGESRGVQPLQSQLRVNYLTPLRVNGLLVARGYNFDRKYAKDLEPAEQIVYDGRVVANTPPGLSDFTKALPIYQQVVP